MEYVEALNDWNGRGLAVFLAGGISNCADWQQTMVSLLSETPLVLVNPRRKNFPMGDPSAAEEQIKWEHHYLTRVDAVLFWFAPETLCPITLLELGTFLRTDVPIFVGSDPNYQRKQDLEVQLGLYRPDVELVYDLDELAAQVIDWASKDDPKRDRTVTVRGQYLAPISRQSHPSLQPCQCGGYTGGACGTRPGWVRRFVGSCQRLLGPGVGVEQDRDRTHRDRQAEAAVPSEETKGST